MSLIPLSRIHGSGGPLSKILLALPHLKTFPHLCTTDSPIPIRLWPTCLMTSLLPLGIPCLRLLGRPSKSVIFLPTFTFQPTTPRKHYNPSSPFQLQVLTKSCLGSSVKIPRYLCRPLASIFNASIHDGCVPSLWKSANVIPAAKSSPALDVDSDFRPISLTPIVRKILESFPYNWLLQSIRDQIDKLQFGSIKGSNTTMALIHLLHKWYEAMDTPGACLWICMLDFSKAFDRIDFNILMQKLINMRVHPSLINWIANFLTDRSQRIKIGSNFSSGRTTNGGVPQGTKLGPLLFLIIVNDLNVSDDTVKFVDDTTIWEIVLKGQESNSVLPSQITESTKWDSENNMKLNPTKEVRVGFSPLDPGALLPITIDGHDIVVVPHAKLLGVMISKDLKWIEHVDYICKKASKRLYALRLLKRSSIPAGKLVRVYTTCVRPILEFSCEVWHYSLAQYLSDEIESIQRRATCT